MLHRIPESRITTLTTAVGAFPKGAKLAEILTKVPSPPPRRTIQYWLQCLAEMGRLRVRGAGRATRYFVANANAKPSRMPATPVAVPSGDTKRETIPISPSLPPTAAAATAAATPARRVILPPDPPFPLPTAPARRRILPPDLPTPAPAEPGPSATATASPNAGRRHNPRLQEAYLERLEFALPRLIRQMVPFSAASTFFRREAAMHFNAADQDGFVAMGLAELAALNDSNRSKYRLEPGEYSYWLQRCGPRSGPPSV